MSDKLVCIAKFSDPGEAQIARGVLESEDIPACLEAEGTAVMLAYVGQALGGVRLMVFADQAEKAKAILAAHEEADLAAIDVGEPLEEDEPFDDDEDEEEAALRRAQRKRQPLKPSKDDEDVSPEFLTREAHIRRAWFAAVIGLCACPPILHVYSLYILLGEDLLLPNPAYPKDWRVKAALIIDVLALLGVAGILFLLYTGNS